MSRDANAQLKNQLNEQREQIKRLQGRISSLADSNAVLKSELAGFKKSVSDDMKQMLELIKKAGERHLVGG